MSILDRILRAGEGKKVKALAAIVPDINAWTKEIADLSDDALKAKTPEFRARLERGETVDDLLAEAFAVVREASANRSSTVSPRSRRARNSGVLAFSASSLRAPISFVQALMSGTIAARAFTFYPHRHGGCGRE